MKKAYIILLLLIAFKTYSQEQINYYKENTAYVLWTFHTENTTVNGIAVGAFSTFDHSYRYVKTNGIRLEIPGTGLFGIFIGNSLLINNDEIDEIINGINISGGTLGNHLYNGITLAVDAQNGYKCNGIAVAGLWNAIDTGNGIQIAGLGNEATQVNGIQLAIGNATKNINGIQLGLSNVTKNQMKGLQIGIYNHTDILKGIQIGFWNVSNERKLPLINWGVGHKEKTKQKNPETLSNNKNATLEYSDSIYNIALHGESISKNEFEKIVIKNKISKKMLFSKKKDTVLTIKCSNGKEKVFKDLSLSMVKYQEQVERYEHLRTFKDNNLHLIKQSYYQYDEYFLINNTNCQKTKILGEPVFNKDFSIFSILVVDDSQDFRTSDLYFYDYNNEKETLVYSYNLDFVVDKSVFINNSYYLKGHMLRSSKQSDMYYKVTFNNKM